MEKILEKLLFTEFNFIKCGSDYTEEGLLTEKIKYFNLNKVYLKVLHLKNFDKYYCDERLISNSIILKNGTKFIDLKGIIELSKLRNDYRMCILHIKLGLSHNEVIQNLNQIISNDTVKYSEQTKFTYIIFKYLQETFPDIKMITEEYLIETEKAYRCDILLPDDNLRIIIEHYESFHKNNKTYDGIRQETLEALGYEYLIFNEGDSIRKFVNNLNGTIKSRRIFLDDNKIDELIITTLVKGGCDEIIAKKLYKIYKIGNNFEIKLKNIILSLGYDCDDYNDAVEDLKSTIPNEYYKMKEDDYYLNSYGYKLFLLRSKNPSVYQYQEYYIKLEEICYQTILESRNKAKNIYNKMKRGAPQLINYGKYQSDKMLVKNLDKLNSVNKELKEQISFYEQERRSLFKIKINDEEKDFDIKLNEGDVIVPYIPSLVFTNDINAEVSISKIKSLHKVFKDSLSTKDRISFKSILKIIKKRLHIENISSYEKIIPNCKIIFDYKNISKISNETDSDSELIH